MDVIDPRHPCGHPDAFFRIRCSRMATKSGKDRAKNRYGGHCHACGRYVPAEMGTVSKTHVDCPEGRWVTYC